MVAAAPLAPCASTSARSATGVTSGASPLTTTTGPSPASSPAAASTAPPVPFGTGWTASATPSGSRPSSAPSGDPTTTTLPAPASTAAATVQSIIGRPQMSWSIFGVRERMRVPWPAARITTVGAVTGRRLEGPGAIGFVASPPLADRVVAHAVAAPDAGVAEGVDLAHELLVGGAEDAACARACGTAPGCPLPARPRAVAMSRAPGEERRAAVQAG